ncbi:hypothetical protein NQ314_019008 [Rhamnusium bicolor]|uniref:Uncharacterized protein n=1 Tax=Rhamnusium bicolor TaxID=1586634 RepID=A0AAV8WNX3_9CUCU|nr:hypothetical protein NQ314_019008 [Rhamnusium bicolor]
MGIAAAQIDILNQKIIGFRSISENDGAGTKTYISNLSGCVKHHNEIIRYIENLERVFSMIFLVQFLTSGAVICNIGFQLVHIQPQSIQFANMVFFFIAMMLQLGMYCWYGNEIIVKVGKDKIYNRKYFN